MVTSIAGQAGFDARTRDGQRSMNVELSAVERNAPLLLFDAADPANLGWFSRCQFYVDGRTGAVMQTPITLGQQARPRRKAAPKLRARRHLEGTPRHLSPAGQSGAHRTGVLPSVFQLSQRPHQDRRGGLRRRYRCTPWRGVRKASACATEEWVPERFARLYTQPGSPPGIQKVDFSRGTVAGGTVPRLKPNSPALRSRLFLCASRRAAASPGREGAGRGAGLCGTFTPVDREARCCASRRFARIMGYRVETGPDK